MFLSVAGLCAAATFGVGVSVVTAGQIGCVEMILSTSVCGVLYALTCGQPVAVTGFGGAHMAFTGVLYGCVSARPLPRSQPRRRRLLAQFVYGATVRVRCSGQVQCGFRTVTFWLVRRQGEAKRRDFARL